MERPALLELSQENVQEIKAKGRGTKLFKGLDRSSLDCMTGL